MKLTKTNSCIILSVLLIAVIMPIQASSTDFLGELKETSSEVLTKVNDYIKKIRLSLQCDEDVTDYVKNMERSELIELAYTLENYHRKVKGQKHLMGGLHDYVFKIPDDHIRKYIFDELLEHPEICKKEAILSLLKESNLSTEEEKDRDFMMGGGIHDFLYSLESADLKKLALGLEAYHRKQKDEFVFGGLHDYINSITDEELRTYISKEVNEHQEVNEITKLKELMANFN